MFGGPGAGITQSHIYVFEVIQDSCMTKCED